MPSNLRPFPTNRKNVSDASREWVGGRFVMPFEIEGEHPIAALWIELPEGFMVGADINRPQAAEGWFAETLRAAMEKTEGKLTRPSRVRVADHGLADELRAAHTDIEVVVAPTPEADEAFASLLASMGANPSSYLEGELPPALILELFQAAERLYRLAPWKTMIEDVIRVDIPRFGIDGGCLAVIGQAKVDYGILLFPSIDAYETFGQLGERLAEGEEPESIGTSLLSLTFEKKRDLPPSMLQPIKQNKWPVAGPNAYPLAQHRDESGSLLPLTESDARTLIAITNALVPFCAMHREVLSGERPDQISESFTGDDVTVRLTYPLEDFDLFEAGDPPPWEKNATVRKAPLPGRNDPCHCGSGKKYKKCHLDKDQEEAAGPEPAPEPSAEAQQYMREFKESYYRKWLDDEIPALGDKTPRQAARSRAGRKQLDLLLQDIENGEQTLPEPERFDVSILRAELGL